MPIIDITIKKGIDDEKIIRCMKELTKVVSDNLENVLPKMVRISVFEVEKDYIRCGKEKPDDNFAVTVMFQLGPGRKKESIMKCMDSMVDTIHNTFDISSDDIRLYINLINGDQFAIGGKLKDFKS
jgi:phenylpyruvate tautomerase PptA (4-oxalocrotonate tautomerase family)